MLPIVHRIVNHIGSNLERELTLRKLASLVRLSPSRTSYLFKLEMGVSIGQFVKNRRLEKARELLETTSLSVKEVRLRIGAKDHSHFAREFKKAYCVSPSEHRASVSALPSERILNSKQISGRSATNS